MGEITGKDVDAKASDIFAYENKISVKNGVFLSPWVACEATLFCYSDKK